ncbi:MAG: hypothetical protein D6686_17490, partial [Alphaproteobacteria bacterium]
GAPARAGSDLGHITSACFSPTLGRWIALAFLRDGRARIGARLRTADPLRGVAAPVRVVHPVFVDPRGDRQHG